MPWTEADVDKHYKGLSDHKKKIWVAVANSVLSKTGDDGSAIRQANGAVNKVHEVEQVDQALEAVLYAKAADLIESVRLQETSNFWGEIKVALNESDPKPRVERDIKGRPVVPTAAQFAAYFEGMAASHIEASLKSARSRWAAAADKKETVQGKAELRALGIEVRAAQAALKQKRGVENAAKKKIDKKQAARYKAIHTSIKKFAGKNPFLHMIAKHVADHMLGYTPNKKARG